MRWPHQMPFDPPTITLMSNEFHIQFQVMM